MDVGEILEKLKELAVKDKSLRDRLVATKHSKSPVTDFCAISTEAGLPLYDMDLIAYGEESYAAMRRSTNGGGENSPLLMWEDDAYELFIAELEALKGED
jgi:hypothetical protein